MANLCPVRRNSRDLSSCVLCSFYRRGICAAPEVNILRQTGSGGYELYYPLKKLLESVVKSYMLSTIEVIKELARKYRLDIARTSIFDYEKLGILEKVKKVGHGDRKGVKTYWKAKTPLKIYYMAKLKEMGLTLKEMARFHDMLYNLKDELKYFSMYVDDKDAGVIWPVYNEVDPVKLSKFNTFLLFMGAFEASIENYNFQYRGGIPKIEISEEDPRNNSVSLSYLEENFDRHYIVLFTKEGVKVEIQDSKDHKHLEDLKQFYYKGMIR